MSPGDGEVKRPLCTVDSLASFMCRLFRDNSYYWGADLKLSCDGVDTAEIIVISCRKFKAFQFLLKSFYLLPFEFVSFSCINVLDIFYCLGCAEPRGDHWFHQCRVRLESFFPLRAEKENTTKRKPTKFSKRCSIRKPRWWKCPKH